MRLDLHVQNQLTILNLIVTWGSMYYRLLTQNTITLTMNMISMGVPKIMRVILRA